jgi:hypothetical protein
MSGGVIPEFQNQRVPIERRLHDATLYSATAAVHDPHFRQPRLRRRPDVLFDNRGDVPRRKGMKVELGFDRYSDWIWISHTFVSKVAGIQTLCF